MARGTVKRYLSMCLVIAMLLATLLPVSAYAADDSVTEGTVTSIDPDGGQAPEPTDATEETSVPEETDVPEETEVPEETDALEVVDELENNGVYF